jgi:hypothetical protein
MKYKKMLKYHGEWAFISSYDGLGGPPVFMHPVWLSAEFPLHSL